jgi:hypothetical protein
MADNDERDDKRDDKEEKTGGLIGETVKKLFTAGVSAAFMTEESVRSYLADLKLPKEVLRVVLEGAQKSKGEIVNRVSNEMVRLVGKMDLPAELTKFAQNHKFKISAEVQFVPIKKELPSDTDEKA